NKLIAINSVSATPIPATISSVPSGLSFMVTGAGCQPGTYPTPTTLSWTPGASCTVTLSTPQTLAGTQYVFIGWADGGVTANPRTVTAPTAAAAYTANFSAQSLLCAQRPSSMVSWWQGDGNISDFLGANNPSASNAVSFVSGKVGTGFTFGSGGYIDIPASVSLASQRYTIQAWVRPDGPGTNRD